MDLKKNEFNFGIKNGIAILELSISSVYTYKYKIVANYFASTFLHFIFGRESRLIKIH